MWPAPSCVTSICERGTTTVWPSENGAGWLTCGFSEIVTASEPCDTAAGITRTRLPITTVPVRELITPLADASPASASMITTHPPTATTRIGPPGSSPLTYHAHPKTDVYGKKRY